MELSEAELQESLERVERGGIPLAAERRLRELGERGGAFTSDLSVADFSLSATSSGLAPVSQVMGSSIYQVGWQNTPGFPATAGGFMFEMESAISDAWNEVRRSRAQPPRPGGRPRRRRRRRRRGPPHRRARLGRKLDRVRRDRHRRAQRAQRRRALRRRGRHSGGRRDASAGAASSSAGVRPAAGAAPVLTELSIADYAKLLRCGLEPLGVVAWSAAFFVRASYATQMMSGLGGTVGFTQNQELPEFTEGVYAARETVMQRMTAQAAQLNATGVLGARINHGVQRFDTGGGRYAQGGLMVTFHAIGTAIRERERTSLDPPETILDLTT